MDPSAQTLVQLVILILAGLLVARVALSIPGLFRRRRHPETRGILVVGVGGGGGNAVDRMVDAGIPGVDFVVCNTDAQALRESLAPTRIRIGDAITNGLGSGGDPDVGRKSAEEDAEKIGRALASADLVFVTAGLGGGTGSGAAPIVAAKAREQGALTIAVVTKPFDFEGAQRREIADEAAARLASEVDALITVSNDRVSEVVQEDASALEAFSVVDGVLLHAVQGIVDLLTAPGLINLDFADVRAIMRDTGPALIGLGRGSGEDRAVDAARQAISSPLLEAGIQGARGILFHVSGPADLKLREVRRAADEIRSMADSRANVIFGASVGDVADGEVMITLIATGLDDHRAAEPVSPATLTGRLRRQAERVTPHAQAPSARQAETSESPAVERRAPIADDNLELPTFLRKHRPPSTRTG
ncbi:MAG TPA: cell division protein FtsZ [Candidatus Limnocylindrales bacterium]|nr:cell division protein FtsZ [Candidatus Limnocylindrales bacterium]